MPPAERNLLAARQAENNRATSDGWGLFAAHRAKVTELLGRGAECGRLCILGAGNCNDIDLKVLSSTYREIHLVDLDGEALERGIDRQGFAGHPAVVLHGGMDVTGILTAAAEWTSASVITESEVQASIDLPISEVATMLPFPFDAVASVCLLSQLVESIVQSVGPTHRRFLELIQAIRAGHLRLLAHLTAPGGTAILVTDIVSTVTCPALASTPQAKLPRLLIELITKGNVFYGVNPAVVENVLRSDATLGHSVEQIESAPPWLWDIGLRRYAVCAFSFRRCT